MKLTNQCPKCFRRLDLVSSMKLGTDTCYQPLKVYKCGHVFIEDLITKRSVEQINALVGDKIARSYQIDGVQFFYDSNYSALIADEMGTGKTAQALLALRNAYDLMGTTLIIVKSAITYQWQQQARIWFLDDPMGNYIITNTKGFIPPGFKSYTISMDTFSRMIKFETKNDTSLDQWGRRHTRQLDVAIVSPHLKALGIKSIIVDECHSFKDPSSMRSKALIGFIKAEDIKHKLFLSGTPIKNRADEYFVTLNLLAPEEFPSLDAFKSKWLMRDSAGRYSRIQTYLEEEFRQRISKFVIRREKKDVSIDLPDFQRDFLLVNVDNDAMRRVYNEELDKLRELMKSKGGNPSHAEISNSLMTLRRLTGMMKIDWAVEEIEEFLDSCDIEKIAIGVHHHTVRDGLYGVLKARGHNVLKLSGEDNSEAKEKIKNEFGKAENRILIINMLAGGVGMDGLQICNNVIVLERQWNSTDEDQFESRFHRSGQLLKVMAKYPLVKGSVDEFFADMVENKRYIFEKTVGNGWDLMGSPTSWKALVNDTINGRL